MKVVLKFGNNAESKVQIYFPNILFLLTVYWTVQQDCEEQLRSTVRPEYVEHHGD